MEKLHAFHKTRRGYLTFGLAELVLLYPVASIALDTANMFAYFFSIVLLIGVIFNLINSVKLPPKKVKSKH